MKKLPALILSLSLVPTIAFAQSTEPPPPPDDAPDVQTSRPPGAEPDMQPPPPPAVPPGRVQASDSDQVGILQGSDDGAREYAGSAAPPPPAGAPAQAGQWVYTSQYGWAWMPYGSQYVDEGVYGSTSPYQYLYCVGVGWSWVAAPWLWGWGAYPYFGVRGPYHFGWYRGLYRSGYGWGRYRGGYAAPRYSSGGRYPAGGHGWSGGRPQIARPMAGRSVSRGNTRSYGANRGSVARGGSGPRAFGGARGGRRR